MALNSTTTPASHPSDDRSAAYQSLFPGVVADSRYLMERVAEAARMTLQARLDAVRTAGEHQAMHEARQQITRLANVMSDRYPEALRKSIEQSSSRSAEKTTRSLFTVHFDELELMDESQISDSVERARARQILISAVDGPLADLDALVCAAQGLPSVQPDQNPLRPDVFLQALQAVVSQMQVSDQVRHDWIGPMAQALGSELRALYLAQTDKLRHTGVQPVGYARRQADGQVVYAAPAGAGAAQGFAADNEFATAASVPADSLLTLDRLRRLLLGELNEPVAPAPAPGSSALGEVQEDFAERFAREFDGLDPLPRVDPPATDFAMTVPAAFEALQEMNQVGQMMERLGSPRPAAAASSADSLAPAAAPRQPASGLGQALSMEVVALMVDNIARDTRLLWPVQQFVRAMEPALMQLALADPRFFSHKEHPARQLLQDMTERSLAFDSTEATGFQSFMRSLMNIAGPLATATIEGADDFEQVLQQLHAKWAESEKERKQERQRAIETLQHAEQRHLLAAKVSRDIWLLPDIDKVPDAILRFLLGPWAKVVAQARLTDKTGSIDPGRYQELVDALIWSAQPELTRTNTGRLARLLPKLLPKLREGLASIDYPPDRTEAVFQLLMQLHQQAFKQAPRPASSRTAPPAEAPAPAAAPPPPPLSSAAPVPALNDDDDDPWVAPSEAKESGFMESSQAPESENPLPAALAPAAASETSAPQLAIGCWVNLLVAGRWERTQLSWIGSNGTFFLFTSAAGRTQSMTLRLVDRLIQQGALHVLAQHNVVDGALDAVAQAAMRNSVESRL
ncbi:DUF1631 family protein [Acidovorax sp. LjRoot194]|uniref:DUF1631 family protein n=1 Tax=Acidovorax sp. LjRoot194 TaxID=3342280 RepID=UPI003ED06D26